MKQIFLVLVLSCLQPLLYGQNFNYSILESSPLQMNPALAGNAVSYNRNNIPLENRASERLCAVHQNSKTIHEKASFFPLMPVLEKPVPALAQSWNIKE